MMHVVLRLALDLRVRDRPRSGARARGPGPERGYRLQRVQYSGSPQPISRLNQDNGIKRRLELNRKRSAGHSGFGRLTSPS